jgi:hypothetical protein
MAVLNLDPYVKQLPAKYPVLPITALALDFVFTAAGANYADGAEFTLTGKEIVIVGGGAAGGTVTVTSVADAYNRTGNITAYAVGTNLFSVLPQFQTAGWIGGGTAGKLHMAASAATVTFAVLRLTD